MGAAVGDRRRARGRRRAAGEEHRAAAAPGDEPWQESQRGGLVVEPLDVSSLRADSRAAVLEVKVLDVEAEQLPRAAGCLVQHPPEGALPERNAWPGEHPLERGRRDRARSVDVLSPASEGVGGADEAPAGALELALE